MTLLSAIGIEFRSVAEPAALAAGRILVVVAVAVASLRVVRVLLARVDDARVRDQLRFFIPKAIVGVLAIVGLAAIGIDVSGMAAIVAAVGVTGAVIFTPVGQNLVAGTMIRVDDIYQVGEVVTVGDLNGTVVHRSLLRTELELPDGSKAWVPNSTFQDNQVLNHSRMGGWRVSAQIPLDCASDRSTAQMVMDQVMASLDWNSGARDAFVAFDHVGSEAMFFTAYAWIDDRTQEPWYRGLLLSTLVDALEAAGVSVGQTTNLSLGSSRRDADNPSAVGRSPVHSER